MFTVEPFNNTSVVPLIVGVSSFVLSGAVNVKLGTAESIDPESLTVVEFPASSCTVALTEKLPSASALGTSAVKLPSNCTTALKVCSAALLPVTIIETVDPGAASVLPVIVGVVSFVLSGALTKILGATVSTLPVSFAVVSLPAPSVILASTV